MSDQQPKKCYVYQPHPVSRKDGLLWAVGGLPIAMSKEDAEVVVDAINEISWLMERCHACGHRLALASTGCPQCGAESIAPWFEPKTLPDKCDCPRCARQKLSKSKTAGV